MTATGPKLSEEEEEEEQTHGLKEEYPKKYVDIGQNPQHRAKRPLSGQISRISVRKDPKWCGVQKKRSRGAEKQKKEKAKKTTQTLSRTRKRCGRKRKQELNPRPAITARDLTKKKTSTLNMNK